MTKTKKSKTQQHDNSARHLSEISLSRLFKIMVAERNSERGKKIPEFEKLLTYGEFAKDYIKTMIAVAIKHGVVKMYKGQLIVVKKFTSRNDVEWDLKYGTTDLSIEMVHRFNHMTVKIDPSFREKHLIRNRPKQVSCT